MTIKSERINLRGLAVYPYLHRADTKFHEVGEWKVGVRMDEEKAKPIMARLGALYQNHTGKKLNKHTTNLWKYDLDDQGEPMGSVVFQTKVKNVQLKDGTLWDRKPKQYDSQANLTEVQVGAGSELVVACDIYAWDAGNKKGISLQPLAVQVLSLAEYDGGDHGFDIIEGGFIGEPSPDNSETDTVVEASVGDGGDDFDF